MRAREHTTSRLLAIAIGSLLTPVPLNAQFSYITNDGGITITGYTCFGGDVLIPGTIDSFPVRCATS